MTLIAGFDVSHHNGTGLDFKAAHRAGYRFVYIKATEGTDYVDPQFEVNWAAAKAAGLYRGAYHFFHPAQDPKVQARHLAATVHDMGFHLSGRGVLPPMNDVEDPDGKGRLRITSAARTFALELERHIGDHSRSGVYVSPGFINAHLSVPLRRPLRVRTLWLAQWRDGRTVPAAPAPWSHVTFWQQSDHGRVAGIGTAVDRDYFVGTHAQLDVLAGHVTTQPHHAHHAQPTLEQGARGPAVKALQAALNAHRVLPHLVLDGAFGGHTADAVRNFQRAHHLTPDGVVGPLTWHALGF